MVGGLSRKDVGNVGSGQVGIVVVHDGRRQSVGAAHEVFAEVGDSNDVVVGSRLLLVDDKDDVVVVEASFAQELIDIEHVGQMAVVQGALAALDENGVLVGELRIMDIRVAVGSHLFEALERAFLIV